ncbi:MAG: division/cell wall cluster transcriptional repressor MraZ [Chloroflexota bacterium]
MFLGEFTHNLDSKGRLTLPAKYREQLKQGLVVTRNPSGKCLLLYPMAEWEVLAKRISELPLANRQSALLRRVLFSGAEDLMLDKQGRILLSQRLRKFAQIDGSTVLAGMNTFIELWNPELWDEQVLQQLEQDGLDEDLFEALGI